ncbi:MAG TPA: alkaline phosphatase family protein [Candidatus Binatia bacterium]|nr:alkaline phosphatase family protein [Candidatus Binatia bacterium]
MAASCVSHRWAIFAFASLFAACSPNVRAPIPLPASDGAARSHATGAGKIKHVVYVVQENRSFDDLFQGYPGADTVSSGKDSKGGKIVLRSVSLATKYELDHSAHAMFEDCHGTTPGRHCAMDGFDKEEVFDGPRGVKYPMYVYVPHSETKPYFDMAHEWVLSDRTFASQLDESFVAHQYIIAAQADSSVNVPLGQWGCGGNSYDLVATITQARKVQSPNQPPCFDYQTLGDELDAAGLDWRFYTSRYGDPSSGALWSGYQAVEHIYDGPDWAKVVTPQQRFLTDVGKGKLAAFTWITPICMNSDHPDCGGGDGPSWVTSIVNAVGKSKFWNDTAIFVQWDDWGGLYDHVPPPYKNYDSLGFRVPLLVISPYAKAGYVSHVQYETASVLRFAEDLFGLAQLSAADRRATSPAGDCFDFTQRPRTFVPIKAPKEPSYFFHQPLDLRPPDSG